MRKLLALLLILSLIAAGCGGSDEGTGDEQQAGGEVVLDESSDLAPGMQYAINPNSVAVVSTLAGSGERGSADGSGSAASFTQPADVFVGPDGSIYAVEFRGNRITRISPEGEVTTLLSSPASGDMDGPAAEARVGNLRSLAVAEDGTIYFVDWENKKLKKLTPEGQVSTVANTGFMETLMLDDEGNVVGPAGSLREVLIQVTPEGEQTVIAGASGRGGVADGPLADATFSNVSGVTRDGAGNIYVSQAISIRGKAGDQLIRKIDAAGEVYAIAGQRFQEGYQDGPGMDAIFNYPVALVAAPDGTLFVADAVNNCIRRVGTEPDYEVTTVAGACGESGELLDGQGLDARLKNPQGLALSEDGVLFVADSLNNAIRKIEFQAP